MLVAERPKLTTALDKLGTFSSVAAGLVNDTKADLVRNLANLEPTLRALADVGPKLDSALAYFAAFPYGQEAIDRGIRGDYLNQFIIFDFTIPRLKKTLLLGTSWGQEGAKLVPAPGDPWYATYTYDPIHAPFSPPPAGVAEPPAIGAVAPVGSGFSVPAQTGPVQTVPAQDGQAGGAPHLPGATPGPVPAEAGGN